MQRHRTGGARGQATRASDRPRSLPLAVGLVLAVGVGSAETTGPAEGPLPEREALARALARDDLANLMAGLVEEQEGELTGTRRWQNPQFSFTFEQAKSGGVGSDEGILFLQQTVEPGKRRAVRVRAAEARVAGARERSRMLRVEVAAKVREAFFTTLAAQERVAAAEDRGFRLTRVAEVVGFRRRAGDASGYDLKAVEREQALARASLAEEEAGLAEMRDRLAGLVGPLPELVGRAPLVVGELLPGEEPEALEILLRRLALRPDLQALREEAEAARLDERVARGWKIPAFTIGGGIKDSRSGGVDQSGPVAYSAVPLPIFDRNQGAAASAAGRRRQAEGELGMLLREAEAGVRGSRTRERRLVEIAGRFRAEAEVPAEEMLRTTEAAYRAGEVGILALLDAYQGIFAVKTRRLELALAARRARIELDRLTGGTEP